MVFGVAILMMSLLAISNPTTVYPNDMGATKSGEIRQVTYYLPYPGVLPDNPLYKLKAIRDRVKLWLTFDQNKKAALELLFADKRINAGLILVEGGKQNLGVATVTKGEKYLEQSVTTTLALQKAGGDKKSMLMTLNDATAKHAELISGMIGKLEGNDKIVMERTLAVTQSLSERVSQALIEAK